MDKISKKHQFILYSLMKYLKKLNSKFENKPLEASVSKIDFINLLKDLKIVEKSVRGLYKNLEILEKRKYIKYENKLLKLTNKGLKICNQKDIELFPYIKLIVKIHDDNVSLDNKYTYQTYFK